MLKTSVNIKKLNENAIVPTYGTDFSAGADLYACSGRDTIIGAHETAMIHTEIAVEIPEGYVGLVCARSGLALKRGLAPANKVGVIDSDYRGELMVALHNHTGEEAVIEDGERIAQLLILPYLTAEFNVKETLEETVRGTGGFGSTGTK